MAASSASAGSGVQVQRRAAGQQRGVRLQHRQAGAGDAQPAQLGKALRDQGRGRWSRVGQRLLQRLAPGLGGGFQLAHRQAQPGVQAAEGFQIHRRNLGLQVVAAAALADQVAEVQPRLQVDHFAREEGLQQLVAALVGVQCEEARQPGLLERQRPGFAQWVGLAGELVGPAVPS
ncbi:hypothetical protein, partial [uncultured Hydrogenophaga sp.]|uniref:hypothetical protein n=1 Tax=uncultured Hydrogenophaga sp. TaxID=199683 RepID=UPI00265EF957